MPINILVVGGAGFIGSHILLCLKKAGFNPIVLDNLSTGHRDAVQNAEFILGDMADGILLDRLFSKFSISAVMHFGSFIQVGESVIDPAKYYLNNLAATLQLLESMRKYNVKNFIFSSTAAVYGEPLYSPIDENHRLAPINPYGSSKRMVEQILEDYGKAYDFRFIIFRYFNAAGADPSGVLVERHEPETHLIPLILKVAKAELPHITVFGTDYPTPDGTCIRDYIHVSDLCSAHLIGLKHLLNRGSSGIYNLGTGTGYSVQEVIQTAKKITGKPIPIHNGKRREGDPATLVADSKRAQNELNWTPHYATLEVMVQHAWNVMCESESVL